MGGFVNSITGKDAKKEAEKARKEAEERARQQEEARKREEQFNKEVEQDTQGLEQAQENELRKGKVETTVDFTKSQKLIDEDEEDKIKKAFRTGLRR